MPPLMGTLVRLPIYYEQLNVHVHGTSWWSHTCRKGGLLRGCSLPCAKSVNGVFLASAYMKFTFLAARFFQWQCTVSIPIMAEFARGRKWGGKCQNASLLCREPEPITFRLHANH